MQYFAYGSNLDHLQMAVRCPRARLVGPARLDGYKLCFPRRSFIRQTAVASIEPAPSASVWGALYDVPDQDVARLDGCEGCSASKRFWEGTADRIAVSARPTDREPVEAMTYVAKPSPDPGLPTADYLSVLVSGAMAFRAPDDYISMLMAQPTAHAS